MDDFYEVYDIMEGDNMYVAPDQRVGIWMIEE
jgi:predicted metalloendopeptidase